MDWKSSLESLRASMPEQPGPGESEHPDLPETGAPSSAEAPAVETARLDIILDKKGRKGKAATIIAGFTISDNAIDSLAAKLKTRLGCGGSARGGEILIQGDKRREVAALLSSLGFKSRII